MTHDLFTTTSDNDEVGNLPDFTSPSGPYCDARLDATGFLCTLRPDHKGWHVAGNGDYVVAIWTQDGETVL